MYLQEKQANRHIQVYGYQRGKVHREGKIESFGINKYTLLCIQNRQATAFTI